MILLDDAVRKYLTPGQVAAVLDGTADSPVYECITCRKRGDSRIEDTSAVLWVSTNPDATVILAWAHARCAPSEVRPQEELGGVADSPPAREDVTYASVANLDAGHTPTITLVPGVDATSVLPDGQTGSTQLNLLRGYGFVNLDLASRTQPAGPAGWAVRVDRGRLVSIGSGAVRWWTSADPPLMPQAWCTAARARRHALVMVGVVGMCDDADQIGTAEANILLRRAADAGLLVGGLLPVRGTLS